MNKRLAVIATSAVFLLTACGAQSAVPQGTGLIVAPAAGGVSSAPTPMATASISPAPADEGRALQSAVAAIRPALQSWSGSLTVCPPSTKIKRFTCKIALDKMSAAGKAGLAALPANVPTEKSADLAALRKVLTTMSTTTAKSTGCSVEFDRGSWGTACAAYVTAAGTASKDLASVLRKL